MSTAVDIFPLSLDTTKLTINAYTLQSTNAYEIGATFAARVRKLRQVPCAWLKDEQRIVAPSNFALEDGLNLLQELQEMKLEGFDFVEGLEQVNGWTPSPNAIAQFIALGVFDQAKSAMAHVLKNEVFRKGIIAVEREPVLKGVVVHGQPALQIGIRSPMDSAQTLEEFYRTRGQAALKGLSIKVKDTKGIFNGFPGMLGQEHGKSGKTYKQKLVGWEPSDYDPKILDKLPDDHPVVELLPNNRKKQYWYPLRVVRIVADMGNLRHLGLAGQDVNAVTRRLKIAPAERYRLTHVVKDALVQFCKKSYPAININDNFSTQTTPNLFTDAKEIAFSTQLCFGSDVASISRDTEMIPAIKNFGLYRYASWYAERKKMRIAVIDAIADTEHFDQRFEQLKRFKSTIDSLGFVLERAADPIHVKSSEPAELRAQLARGLNQLIRSNPDIILVYLPDTDRHLRSDDPLSLYNTAKAICVGAGTGSQMIFEKTITTTGSDADANLIMGILAKTGNIPYVLGEPLEYLDVIVGLDISRRPTKNGGSLNTAAMSRVYTNNGALLGYAVSGSMLLDGETISQSILERIL